MIQLTFAQKENIGFQYVLDALQPCSPYGQALVRALRPYTREELPELKRQLGNVNRVLTGEEACRKPLSQLLRIFMTLRMIRTTVKKCLDTSLNEIDLFEIKRFLLKTHEMLPLWQEIQSVLHLEGIVLADTEEALDLLDPQRNRVASFYIADSSSPVLRALRREKRELEEYLRLAPGDEVLLARRSRVAAEEEHEEMWIRGQLSDALRPHIPVILQNMDAIADLDLTLEKAKLARRYGGVMPTFTEDRFAMEDMVNPQIADLLDTQGKAFTPVSIALQTGATVITGANMGGKSVALKTIALNILLIHCGFFPFAKSAATPIFDSMHIISEDLESIDRGLSSFGGEIVRFNQLIRQLQDGYAFILLDEFARGTNPDEGAAIVQAVTEYLNRQNAVTVLATHYDNVAPRANAHYQVVGLKNLDMEALRAQIAGLEDGSGMKLIGRHMNYGLYRVLETRDCPRDALNICRLLGMDRNIIEAIEKYFLEPSGNY